MLYYGNYTEAKGLTRIDKELSIKGLRPLPTRRRSVMCAPCAPATLISLAVIRTDKELSISNSTNIGEVSGGIRTGGVVGGLENYVNSAGQKLYSHNTSFSIIGCGNRGQITATYYYNAGIVGIIINAMSYGYPLTKQVADTIVSQIIIKYCFNIGSVTGDTHTAGIAANITVNVGQSETTYGGKIYTEISNNYNAASLNSGGTGIVGSTIGCLRIFIRSEVSCFSKTDIFNNFNMAAINSTTGGYLGGIIGPFETLNIDISANSVDTNINSNYNYSTELISSNANTRGIVARFTNNASFITLSNNYSAYKREANSNIYGSNPAAPNGANVGAGR